MNKSIYLGRGLYFLILSMLMFSSTTSWSLSLDNNESNDIILLQANESAQKHDNDKNILNSTRKSWQEGEQLDTIPIIAILSTFGTPIIIIGLIVFFRNKRHQELHKSIRAMVEKGVEIPDHIFQQENSPNSPLKKGIILISVGLGLMSFFALTADLDAVGIGLIPLCIGLGYLLIWKLEKAKDTENN